jgi:hypothetical protein
VMRNHVYGFHACTVYSPLEWYCLDTTNQPVGLGSGAMIWQELKDSHEVAVSKAEYLRASHVARTSPRP